MGCTGFPLRPGSLPDGKVQLPQGWEASVQSLRLPSESMNLHTGDSDSHWAPEKFLVVWGGPAGICLGGLIEVIRESKGKRCQRRTQTERL